jgi:nitrogen regulatory protein PII
VDLPDEQVDEVIKKVLANVSTDKIGDVLGGLFKK